MQSGSFSPTVVASPDSANYGVLHVRAGEERPHNGTILRSDRSCEDPRNFLVDSPLNPQQSPGVLEVPAGLTCLKLMK
jgi:hypothetical protein